MLKCLFLTKFSREFYCKELVWEWRNGSNEGGKWLKRGMDKTTVTTDTTICRGLALGW